MERNKTNQRIDDCRKAGIDDCLGLIDHRQLIIDYWSPQNTGAAKPALVIGHCPLVIGYLIGHWSLIVAH